MGVHFKENEEKVTLGMIIAGIVIIVILLTSLIIYLLNVNDKNMDEFTEDKYIASTIEQDDDEFNTVSIDIGKSVNDASNELNTAINVINNETNKNSTVQENIKANSTKESTTNTEKEEPKENTAEETKKEVQFTTPIKGEIIKDFAPDSLVYSETLEEWVTHNGVDIKADKTSIVTAATEGTVYAIKNDPRYGLTVIVNHDDGYQTIYANLLTAEFVVEGEKIQAGQTIGTVGNSATFEIADDYHLHFEMQKDGEYINPSNYIQF